MTFQIIARVKAVLPGQGLFAKVGMVRPARKIHTPNRLSLDTALTSMRRCRPSGKAASLECLKRLVHARLPLAVYTAEIAISISSIQTIGSAKNEFDFLATKNLSRLAGTFALDRKMDNRKLGSALQLGDNRAEGKVVGNLANA
jgi:hypothetical protein